MRIARLLSVVLAVLTAGLVLAPVTAAEPPFRVPDYVTDRAGALSPSQRTQVEDAVDKLYNERRVRLWVVYVDSFGQDPVGWARVTMQISDFGDYDALLAVATDERSYAFQVPSDVASQSRGERIAAQRDRATTAAGRLGGCRRRRGRRAERTGGLDRPVVGNSGVTWLGLLIAMAVLGLLILALYFWSRRRRRKRREAEFAAAKRVDPADPNALAAVPIDALDDLSKMMVVDVDNAVRTSDSELALAVEEFGSAQTETFSRAVGNAKTTLAQAFNVRQILDDAVPETPQQRRDLLTRVVVAAAKADRELDAQAEAFDKLRDLVINAPTRLDALTQQMVDLTARLGPSEQALAALHSQFDAAALTSVADNVGDRQAAAGFRRSEHQHRAEHWSPGRSASRWAWSMRSAPPNPRWDRRVRCSTRSTARASTSIAPSPALPDAIADIQNGINQANGALQQGTAPTRRELDVGTRRRQRPPSPTRSKNGSTDPLGTFTRLTKADAELDRLLATVDRGTRGRQTPQQGVRSGAVLRAVPRAAVSRTSSTPAAAASDPRPAPGSPKRSANSRPPRTRGRPTSARPSRTPTVPTCWPARRRRWPAMTSQAAQRSYTSGWRRWRRRLRHGRGHRRHHHRQHPQRRDARRLRWWFRRRARDGPVDVVRRVIAVVGTQLQRRRRPLLAAPERASVRVCGRHAATNSRVSTHAHAARERAADRPRCDATCPRADV